MPEPRFAFGHDLGTARRRLGARLFEGLRVGAPFPDLYANRTRLAELAAARARADLLAPPPSPRDGAALRSVACLFALALSLIAGRRR